MATKVLVPLLGEGVEEVTVIKWLKQEGDTVNELEPLLEVNTDKVDTEIPAPATGTVLKIMAEEGLPAKVGSVLAFIGKPGEMVDGGQLTVNSEKQTPVNSQPIINAQPETDDHQLPTTNRELGFISPVVAKIAAEHGVNLQEVSGSGLQGRITKNDVLDYVEGRMSKVESRVAQPANLQPSNLKPVAGDQLIKHTTIRKQIVFSNASVQTSTIYLL